MTRICRIVVCMSVVCFMGSQSTYAAKKQEKKMEKTSPVGASPMGVLEFLHWNHDWNSYKYPDAQSLEKVAGLMKQAGVGWVRQDFLWQDIEPEQGKFDFAKYDAIVDELVKNNIRILGLLNYGAPWASASGAWNEPPRENGLFVNYAVRVIDHYKDRIKYWEVWNEPDSRIYWAAQDGLKRYCELLREVYAAAKKVDPECRILNGGLAEGASSINRLYDNGAQGSFDILNIHIFQSPLQPGSIKAVEAYPRLARKIMTRNGDGNKKIWVTEIGSPGVPKELEVKNWWMGANPDEVRQASWLREVFSVLLKDRGVEKVFWAFFRDCDDHWDNGTDYFGLVRWDYSKKPAFHAYKETARKYRGIRK